MFCDMKALGLIDSDEVNMVKDTLDWLMRHELEHLRGCEDNLARLIREAKALQIDDESHADFHEWDTKIQTAHQELISAAEQCEEKFKETVLFVGRPGNA